MTSDLVASAGGDEAPVTVGNSSLSDSEEEVVRIRGLLGRLGSDGSRDSIYSGMSDGFQVSSSQINSGSDSDVVVLEDLVRVEVYYDDFVTANVCEDQLEPQEAGRDILEYWEGVPDIVGRVGGSLPIVSSGSEALAQILSDDDGGDSFTEEVVVEQEQELEVAPGLSPVKDNLSDHENGL